MGASHTNTVYVVTAAPPVDATRRANRRSAVTASCRSAARARKQRRHIKSTYPRGQSMPLTGATGSTLARSWSEPQAAVHPAVRRSRGRRLFSIILLVERIRIYFRRARHAHASIKRLTNRGAGAERLTLSRPLIHSASQQSIKIEPSTGTIDTDNLPGRYGAQISCRATGVTTPDWTTERPAEWSLDNVRAAARQRLFKQSINRLLK